MLNEIIRNVGYENIENELKNDITKISNSMYIKIPLNRDINEDSDIVKNGKIRNIDDINIGQIEIIEWFKERELYSEYINSNKAVSNKCKKFPKIIMTCTPYSIIFNSEKIIKKTTEKKYTEDKEELFELFFNEFLEIFNRKELLVQYKKVKPYIIKYFDKNNSGNNKKKIKIFLEQPSVDDYKEYHTKHFEEKILNNGTEMIIESGEKIGEASYFYNTNDKKPFLGYMLPVTNYIQLVNEKDALKLLQLNSYMKIKNKETIINDYEMSNMRYESQQKNGQSSIDDFNVNPYKIADNIPNIDMLNVLNREGYEENRIKNKNELKQFILRLLDFKVIEYYGDKNKTENKFKTFSAIYFKHINNIDMEALKKIYKNMVKNIYRLYIYGEDMDKITNIISFDICMNDYLFNTNIKEDLESMINQIKQKILDSDKQEEYTIENDMEFYILCGQLAKYLKFKTQTDKITNKLFYEYNMATRTRKLINILQNDKTKFDYDGNNNNRAGKILYGINNYYTINENRLKNIDKIRFNMGLYYGDCILYVSNKKDEAKKDESKGVK